MSARTRTRAQSDAQDSSVQSRTVQATSRSTAAILTPSTSPRGTELSKKFPTVIRFPVIAILTLLSGTLAHEAVAAVAGSGELRSISRNIDKPSSIAASLSLRILELAIVWFGGYDPYDAATLTALAHLPHAYLLTGFYSITRFTAVTTLLISTASTFIPFSLFRKPTIRATSFGAAYPLYISTTLLASMVYVLPLLASLFTWLPGLLVAHHDELRSIMPARNASLLSLGLALAPMGPLASQFLFAPLAEPAQAAGEVVAKADAEAQSTFDPATASLWETVQWNVFWWRQYSKRAQVLLSRMATLAGITLLSNTARVFGEVKGVDVTGAAAWAAVWGVSSVLGGLVLGWVGDVW